MVLHVLTYRGSSAQHGCFYCYGADMVGLAGDCYAVDTTAGSSCAKVRRHEQSVRARSLDFQEAIVPARRSSGEESGAMVHNSGAYSWGNMPSL